MDVMDHTLDIAGGMTCDNPVSRRLGFTSAARASHFMASGPGQLVASV